MAYYKPYKNSGNKSYYKKPAPVVKVPRQVRNWSTYQHAIFDDIESGVGNTQVDALAGSGKTSSIVEGSYYVPRGKSTLMCAFNKSIQVELASRMREDINVLTLHALGFRAIRNAFGQKTKVDNDKVDGYIKAEIGDEKEVYELRDNLKKAVSLAKGYLADTSEEIDVIMDKHGVDTCENPRPAFIDTVVRLMEACKNDTMRIDFDDMVWFPNVHSLRLDKHDFVFIDESQDLNKAQIELAMNSRTPTGRVVSVGDENQAIYGFRGADEHAIQNIVDRCSSKRLPLSVTYRCAKNIVKLAQTLVPELEAFEEAEDGLIDTISSNKLDTMVKPGDFVLSRINAPLIRWCMAFLKAGIPANIQGRDVGKSLEYMIKKSKASDIVGFLSWLSVWRDNEIVRLSALRRDFTNVEDRYECLIALCEGASTLADVKENIKKLFSDGDDTNRVMLSSTHKAKGLERDRVFLLKNTYRPSKGQEEKNLYYVAITRARRELYLVEGI